MNLQSVWRRPRRALVALLVTLFAVAGGIALGASPAHAQTQDVSVTLSPTSGSDYSTDTGTVSWTVPSVGSGDYVDVFLYQGTAPWDLSAMNQALGNTSQSQYYAHFYGSYPTTAGTGGSTSWPNVASGYTDFQSATTYPSTAALISALGTGTYTLGVVVDDINNQVVLDSSGNPVGGSILLNIGASGNSWAEDQGTDTTISLAGQGLGGGLGNVVSLNATVKAADGSTPAGGVNFYANADESGTPLNGSTPVPVGSNGEASYSGVSGYTGATLGSQPYSAQFVPASSANYVGSTVAQNIDLTGEDANITVTAAQDPSSSTTVDLSATATGSPSTLASLGAGSVQFFADGKQVGGAALLNSSGEATATVTGVTAATHTYTAQLEGASGPLGLSNGFDVTVNSASLTTVTTVDTATPTISGTAAVGDTLTAHPGTWGPSGVHLVYQWLANGTAISGATGSTLTLGTAEYGQKISVEVIGYLVGAVTEEKTSAETAAVAKGTLTSATPVITNIAKVGYTLRITTGTWTSGTTFTYQWLANGSKISGATGSTLSLGTAEYDKKISVEVTGSKTDYNSVTKTSAQTATVVKGSLEAPTPKVYGTLKPGYYLRITLGTWTPGTSFKYQWLANGSKISGATSSSLKLGTAEEGKRISVQVTGSKTDYTTITRTSAQTGTIAK